MHIRFRPVRPLASAASLSKKKTKPQAKRERERERAFKILNPQPRLKEQNLQVTPT